MAILLRIQMDVPMNHHVTLDVKIRRIQRDVVQGVPERPSESPVPRLDDARLSIPFAGRVFPSPLWEPPRTRSRGHAISLNIAPTASCRGIGAVFSRIGRPAANSPRPPEGAWALATGTVKGCAMRMDRQEHGVVR